MAPLTAGFVSLTATRRLVWGEHAVLDGPLLGDQRRGQRLACCQLHGHDEHHGDDDRRGHTDVSAPLHVPSSSW